ncbi:MAG: AAA family ATPase [Lachnospiraceae bacterium]|nr:AAA family ATPase [Lachnospiraceae bacterium]
MDIETLAEMKRQGDFESIINWADEEGLDNINDGSMLIFAAESYERKGRKDEAVYAYRRALKDHSEETAAEGLFKLLRAGGEGAADSLTGLADFLEESCLSDEIMLLSRFETSRLKNEPLSDQLSYLKEYLSDFSNDEDYYGLYIELLREDGNEKEAERQINRYNRLFDTTYDPDISIKRKLYAASEVPEEKPASEERISLKSAVPAVKQKKASTQIPTVSLSELAGSRAFSKFNKTKERAIEPPSIEERFEDIVGMKEAREKLSTLYHVMKMQRERQDWNENFEDDMLRSTCFLVTGKKGYGKTLLAATIGSLLYDFGIRGAEEAVSVEAKDFEESLDTLNTLDDVTLIIENVERVADEKRKFGDFAWKIRKFLKEHKDKISIIITGEKESAENLLAEEPDIGLDIYMEIDIEPYDGTQMTDIFLKIADRNNWLLDEEALKLVSKQIPREMKLSTFRGGHTLDEKLSLAKLNAAERFELMDDVSDEDMVTLRAADFENQGVSASVPELLKKLDSLTGLASVKTEVAREIDRLITAEEAENAGAKRERNAVSLHMVFKGAPGTGKTTVARIIGEIYVSLGILPGNKEGMIECDSSDLVGQYIGETAQKTKAMIDRAMGGVLFVDEAYGMTQNQFGSEAVTALIKAMEDYRESLMVIFAGYTKEMDEFLDLNPGLRSRIGKHIIFEDYSEEEMLTIFQGMIAGDKRYLDKDVKDSIKELIAQRSKVADFGNARGVRNLVTLVESAQDERLSNLIRNGKTPDGNEYDIIRKEDVEAVLNHRSEGSKDLDDLLRDLDALEGLRSLKEAVYKNVNAVKAANRKKEMGLDGTVRIENLHLVFKGGPGTGKTTVARKIGYIYKALGLLPRGDELNEYDAADFIGTVVGETEKKVEEKVNHSLGSVLFIDEAYQWSRSGTGYGQQAIDRLVKFMEDKRDKFMVILAGYTAEMDEFLSKNPGLTSRISEQIVFEDFSPEELLSIFRKMTADRGFKLQEGAESTVKDLLKIRSSAKDFGNARGVRNTLDEVLRMVDERIAETDPGSLTEEDCLTIMVSDVEKLLKNGSAAEDSETVETLLNELDQMTGLSSVKAKVHQIVGEAQFNKLAEEQGLSTGGHGTLHLLFKGNAGTGKTTIARTLGKIYYLLGMLKKPDVTECDRSSLVAGYVGQTAAKTQEVINRAMGGILFVDEAYTLASGGENDYGKEALTTIMKAMEDNRDDLMVIFAGYEKEIDELLNLNQGLSSRFSKQNEVIFEDYTDEELTEIFIYQAHKKGMVIDDELRNSITERIRGTKAETKDFGNARGVRNLVEETDARRKQRIAEMALSGQMPDKDTMQRVIKEDIR